MKRVFTAAMVAGLMLAAATVSFAGEKKNAVKKAAPVKLTAAQLDQVVAGRQAGYDTRVNDNSGRTGSVGDNTNSNNQRGNEGKNGSRIYDWNSN